MRKEQLNRETIQGKIRKKGVDERGLKNKKRIKEGNNEVSERTGGEENEETGTTRLTEPPLTKQKQ